MIPETAGAFLAFLALVAPGLVFEMRRERRVPAARESAFREASRVALSSLVFTLTSLAIVAALLSASPQFFADLEAWFARGLQYVTEEPLLAAWTLLLPVAIACSLAFISDLTLARSRDETGNIRPGGLWFRLLRENVPKDCSVWAHVRLTDGTTFWGYVRNYTPGEALEEQELALEGIELTQQDPAPATPSKCRSCGVRGAVAPPQVVIGRDWETVILRGEDIRYIRVVYMHNRTGEVQWSLRRLKAMEAAASAKQP